MSETLKKYNQKRDFNRTKEPEGKMDKSAGRLKFVVQHHIASRDHYDLRLEWGGVLLSFAVPKGPSYNTADKRLAAHVEDHPLDYRNFEGNIPKGDYGGGVVMLWDEGFYEPLSDAGKGIKEGSIKFILYGERLKGKWALVRMNAKEQKKSDNWLLIKEKDEFAKETAGISGFNTSIRTGRTMDEIEKEQPAKNLTKKSGKKQTATNKTNPFTKTGVQLAKLATALPEGANWVFELKYDGYRILAYLESAKVKLVSRNGNDYTKQFQDVTDSLINWANGRAMVLDGEMAVIDKDGKTDFQALQNYIKNPEGNLSYIIFDLLALDGKDLRERPLSERKEKLKQIMEGAPDNLHFSKHSEGNGKESLKVVCEKNFEGLIAKRADSVYSGTRNGDWIKLKCDNRQEFIIGGYTITEKNTSGVSSVLLGYYENNDLIYAGRAGTGFTEASAKALQKKFDTIMRKNSPFKNSPKIKNHEKITWIKPEYAAEIKFAEWTKDNLLRQASFKGLRNDKDINEIVREQSDIEEPSFQSAKSKLAVNNPSKTEDRNSFEGVNLTNPDKLLFINPRITKSEVAQYYMNISKRMLPYVENRVLSLVCCPKGVSDSCFFKKHHPADGPGIVKVNVLNGKGDEDEYFCVSGVSGIIFQVQNNTLEFHVWGSRADNMEKPDMMVFDLDPDEGMGLDKVRQGAKDLKSVLDNLSLISFLKTSGGKGYHIVVPFKPSADWDAFRLFAKNVAEIMQQKWPDRYTSNVRKANRKGKIFVDWIRNGRGATSIAPYSIRARNGASVSMPIEWNELSKIAPDGIKIAEALKRLEGKDPWKNFYKTMSNQLLK